jgi:citrate synthase
LIIVYQVGELVDARTAARRLGVDVRTLYAYVSRGALRRIPGPDGRSSRYDSDELNLLARRARPRTLPRPAASIDLVIATRISTVADGMVRYRGVDVRELVAARRPFERVAELLWQVDGPTSNADWRLPTPQARSLRRQLGTLNSAVPVLSRFAVVLAANTAGRSETLGLSDDSAGPDWRAYGRFAIACLVDASGTSPHSGDPDGSIAQRLWQHWSPLDPTAARVRVLNAALVLLAEHELALSTLAVRVAASARAAPTGCLLAGLGCLEGSVHGGAARAVHDQLTGSRTGQAAPGERRFNPGFGHPIHRHADPRAAPLLDAVHAIATPADRRLISQAQHNGPAPPNVDFALAALALTARMPASATTAIFAVARTAGWVAHAAEEYTEQHLRLRGRALDNNQRS